MTPSFWGRIQTRVLLLATVGLVWTLLVTPFLPARSDGFSGFDQPSRIGSLYGTTLSALFLVTLLGVILWEPIYHIAQQFRWEKDWPTLFGLVTGLSEGLVVWVAVRSMVMESGGVATDATFWVHFLTTWVLVWLAANGPLRVVVLRWRYRGGRLW